MRNLFWRFLSGGMAIFVFVPLALAQAQARPGTGRGAPDLSGVWIRAETARTFNNPKEEPPMQPWAAQQYRAVQESAKDAVDLLVQTQVFLQEHGLRNVAKGRDDLDPVMLCAPPGPTRILMLPRPFEIVQQPQRVLMLFEWDHLTRQIFTDGRGHPEGFPTSWMGHSIGRWDGDTLVVDTAYLNELAWLDSAGHPQTEEMRIEERYRRVAPDRLEVNLTFNDPKAYTRPWTGRYAFKLMTKREIAEHTVCEDWLELPSDPRP